MTKCPDCGEVMLGKGHECPNQAPRQFVELMADWMIEHGPDGHCDGHEQIAQLAWGYFLSVGVPHPQTKGEWKC